MKSCRAVLVVSALLALHTSACSKDGSDGNYDGGSDADTDTDVDSDADGGSDSDADTDTDTDTEETPFGEVVIEQIYFPGTVIAEAILVVGPDGTSALIDTANDGQSAEVFEAVERRLGARAVDWVVITHYHNDHIGGFDNLFVASAVNGYDPIAVTRGVVTRGFVDVADDTITVQDFLELCGVLASEEWAALRFDLCSATSEMPCGGGSAGVPWPADGCPGLLLGDLGDPADDGDGLLTYLALGGGARLYLYQADGRVAASGGVISADDEGLAIGWGATDPENARSVGGALRWGDFTWTFNGDTPAAAPAMEGFIVEHADGIAASASGPALIPASDADVVHLGHHGLPSATGQSWVDWLLPDDGGDRNAEIGGAGLYYHSPAQEVLDRVGARVGEGRIWTTALGLLPGSHEKLIVADGAVVIRVVDGGASYEMSIWSGGAESELHVYDSTVP
jgi:hypothetical protein